jgi:LmbE family N-acetylglucosaminyl deacetylase
MSQRLLLILIFSLTFFVHPSAQSEELQGIEPLLSHKTRLMVFSPHPDDESLGAAGMMQRVLSLGGKVEVVFMTNGDGYPEGVEKEDRITHPTAIDYRKYGAERVREALDALSTLGVKKRCVIFLGFPDGGLCYLLWKYRSDPQAYVSPFTMESHPPASEMIIPHTRYNGDDLRTEIERVLARFRPNLVAVTPPEDEHPDHCSTYYFVREAMERVKRKEPSIRPILLRFLIHFEQWPYGQGAGGGTVLKPPNDFPNRKARWISFPLRPKEAEMKRKAIFKYHSQMLVIGPFLMSFSRNNELFLVGHQELEKELEKMPCCWK